MFVISFTLLDNLQNKEKSSPTSKHPSQTAANSRAEGFKGKMQILAKIREEADGDASEVEGPRIGIALGKGQSGKLALKWALEKVIPPEALVCFLHVQTPLRSIPNGIGGKYPVENVSPETVKKYKEQLFLEIGRIIKECRMLCDKKKVTSEVYHVESDSVQKGVVDQVYKLGITTLVLGKSSQNALSRALKKDIPTSIAKHTPKFCTVLVVCKGKLYYMKDATQSPTLPSSTRSSNSAATDVSISEVSETSVSSTDTNQDEMMTNEGTVQDERRNYMWCGVEDDEGSSEPSGSPSLVCSQGSSPLELSHMHSGVKDDESSSRPSRSPSVDFSHSSSPLGLSNNGSNVENQNRAIKSILGNQSTPFEARLLESEAIPFHQSWSLLDYNNAQFTPSFGRQASEVGDVRSVEESVPDTSDGKVNESTISTVHPGDLGSAATSVAANQSVYMTMDDSEIILYPNCDHALSQMSTDIGTSPTNLSIIEGSSAQKPLHMHRSVTMGASMTFANKNEGLLASEFDMLLNEARQSSEWAQKEAQRQASNLRKTEEVIANAQKMLAGHARRWDEALEDALRDQEILQKRVAEEVRRHQETHTELETLKRMVNSYVGEADLAKQEAEAERKRCEEVLLKLEEVTKKLELECQLRKEAEDKASQEAVAKLDAIMALRKEQQKFSEYSFQELQTATNDFHEENKLGEGGYGPVYRGKLYHTTVAIKVLAREGIQGHDEFQKEVEFLSRIHHPHMVMLLGACPEKGCLVYEYMENGSLEDRLNCKDGTPPLPWYVRFRICLEVATALLFLHSRPEPIIHRDLKPGNILLNHHFVSKIGDAGLAKLVPNNVSMYKESMLVGTFAYIDPDYQRTGIVSRESDVYSLGIVMLQLLTGRAAVGVADLVEAAVDNGQLESVLDKSAGEWPLSEAMVLACLSMQCAEPRRRHRPNLETKILPDLERIQSVAGIAAANMACAVPSAFGTKPITPSFFFCPISQEIMENPHMAADGFTYEHDAIKVWLQGHDTSPMTNLPLNHKTLIPNHTLRSTINDWHANALLP